MKLNSIGLAAACSLMCVAFSQSIEARSVRADEGNGSGWGLGSQLNTASSYAVGNYLTLTPGVSSSLVPYAISYDPAALAPLNVLTDVGAQTGTPGLVLMSPSALYNWYSPGAVYSPSSPQVSPADQIAVYTLDNNSTNSANELPGSPPLTGDIEVQINYTGSAAASFTIGGYTFTSTGSVPDGDFLFSSDSSHALLGFLNDDSSGVSLTSCTQAAVSPCLSAEGWTEKSATPSPAPEIDSSSAITALTLLAGALATLQGSVRRRIPIAHG